MVERLCAMPMLLARDKNGWANTHTRTASTKAAGLQHKSSYY